MTPKAKGPPLGRPFRKFVRDARSAVHAVFQRLGDGHLDDLVGVLLHLLAGGGVAHHARGTLAAVDLADTRQGHGTAGTHFTGDDRNNGVQCAACGFLVCAHFIGQSGNKLGLGHRFCHFLVSFNCPICWGSFARFNCISCLNTTNSGSTQDENVRKVAFFAAPAVFRTLYRKAVSSKLLSFRLWIRASGMSRKRSIARIPIIRWRATCVL